ncbi:MAG: von Willebrand factor type A domain-containing protein [Luteolibacter sp.]
MKDPLHTIPDEHLEARVTAYILGEASPFETAEIESLIEQSPELRLFANRTRTLHTLLQEAETTSNSPSAAWKLPPEKRDKLEAILGSESPAVFPKEKNIRRASFRAAIGIAAVFLITMFLSRFIVFQKAPMMSEDVTIVNYMSSSEDDAERQEIREEPQAKAGGVIVDGQVTSPQAIEKENLTLGEAIVRAGGATEFGSTKRVKVYRDGEVKTYDLSKSESEEVILQPGDTIEVPQKNWFGCGSGRDEAILAEAKKKAERTQPQTEPEPMADAFAGGSRSADESLKRDRLDGLADKSAAADSPPPVVRKPTAPASSPTKEIVTGTAQSPVPSEEIALNEKASFANGDEFGDGWGKGKKQPEDLDDPIRTNPALTEEYSGKVDEVRRNLELGELEAAKDTYDQTRSELLSQVDKAWDLSVPADQDFDGFANNGSPIADSEFESPLPQQIDITTKSIDITQANNRELRFDWITPPFSESDGKNSEYLSRGIDFGDEPKFPVTPATPTTLESLDADAAPILGDIPFAGKLFQQPAIDLANLSEESPTAQDPYSTFSLNISDTSFQLALSAIKKGERPDPESIKPEQFYNAVNYSDPSPSPNEPGAAAIGQVAHPVIPGRNLVRLSVRTASTGRAASQPLVLTLLVDQSGSMARADRRAAMETALAQLSTLLTENDRITVIGFSRTPRLLADSLPGNEAGKLPDLINQTASEGGTNLEQAITLAEDLATRHHLDGAQNRIVLFTDGAANLGNSDPAALSDRIETLRKKELAFDIAGIGTDDLNDRLLSELARHGNGRYYLVGENTAHTLAKQLAGAFRPAAENVKIQVKFNPERVATHKLIGFEEDRLKTEDFRNDSVDAAELAADESGTALYQIQPLSDGSGEIGELSVRFRDTATGEMVERTWTIPYDPSTPPLDQADPAMQLATLALLTAQKLQPGPLADAIRFPDLATTIAAVKQSHPEATDLFTLINALK